MLGSATRKSADVARRSTAKAIKLHSTLSSGKWGLTPLTAARASIPQITVNAVNGVNTFSSTAIVNGGNVSPEELRKITATALIHEMNLRQMETSNKIVPWFYENMPPSYFRQVDEELRKQHLTVVVSAQELGQSDLTVKISHQTDEDTREITFLSVREASKDGVIKPGTVGSLAGQLASLEAPKGMHLNRVKVFSAKDHSISVNIFTFEDAKKAMSQVGATRADAGKIMDLIADMKAGTVTETGVVPEYSEEFFGDAAMDDYLSKVTPMYCDSSTPRRFLIQRQMYEDVRGTDATKIHIEKSRSNTSQSANKGTWFTLVSADIMPQDLLSVSATILAQNGLSIDRAHLDTVLDDDQINDGQKSYVTMLRLLVEDHPLLADPSAFRRLGRHLQRGKWIDEDVLDLGLVRRPELGVDRAEILHGIYSMLHGVVGAIHPQSYASVKNMHRMVESSDHMFALSSDIAQLFIDRFKPGTMGGNLSEEDFQSKLSDLKAKINVLHHEAGRTLLLKSCDAVELTLKTNFFHEERYSLGLRVDPRLMVPEDKPMPYGIIFASGRNFQFFQNRFRDIARGGLRIVTPPNAEQHSVESSRVYGECYGLSWAQQLKNKDIPEGGSKAVCLVNTPRLESLEARYQASRTALRASVDAILDLTVSESTKNMKDFFGKDEVIFLGPDEQVVPSDCDWICHRAGQRGYPMPMAFMSSKVGAGINHKEYGVTSEGVAVYMESALNHALGINPRKDPFSVKITGGPDGDVGGNLIKILFREFPNTAKVVGVADGMGVAEDPEGLDGAELVRLFNEAKPITFFDRSKLSSKGLVLEANDDEGIARRNSMCFRVKSDVFVPAGGRPGTINSKNWKNFLTEDGTPSSPLIVEGANIFTTPEARDLLFQEAGVAIVKDSSANKCGVVTSSCEVATSMLLTTDEFLEYKDEVVADVIKRLHIIAKSEAELLFREYKNYPGALPHFSERISNAINLVTDCITDYLQDVNPGDPLWNDLMPLVKENLPLKLADVAWDRAPEKFPLQYQKNSMASTLASKMVYQEGIHLIEAQPENKLAERAIEYYKNDCNINDLLLELEASHKNGTPASPEAQAQVIKLLKKGGTRASCDSF